MREMISSGNYFLPTINGEIYFDKPLLSYWLIAPFALAGGMSEGAARMPSALAGIGCVLLIFTMGRRLFGERAGLVSAGFLLTTVMFIFWSRTASAEILNVLSVWLMLWAFITGGIDGQLKKLIFLYALAATSAFLKGPVAPAVGFSAIGFYSLVRCVTDLRTGRPSRETVKKAFFSHFKWVASGPGLLSIGVAFLVFAALFLMPVMATGSWQSAELMWRENVLRFVKPFDHVEPPYAYLKHTLVFFAPWSLILLGSLWAARTWPANWAHRWTLLMGLAIFLFFTASGSRRSYYILPLVPALALIAGKALSDWLAKPGAGGGRSLKVAIHLTATLPGLAGIALVSSYFIRDLPHHPVQILLGVISIAGSIIANMLLLRGSRQSGALLVFSLVFVLEVWGFTGGMAAMEEMRSFRSFCREAVVQLQGVEDGKIALLPGGDSSLVFYLDRGPLKTLADPREAALFWREHPDGVVIAESSSLERLSADPAFRNTVATLVQTKGPREKNGNRLAIFRLRPQ